MESGASLAAGLRLYQAGRYFEAHEAWETLWRLASGPERELLQGLIQAAVALHHAGGGNRRGAEELARSCRRRLGAGGALPGLDIPAFLADFERLFSNRP